MYVYCDRLPLVMTSVPFVRNSVKSAKKMSYVEQVLISHILLLDFVIKSFNREVVSLSLQLMVFSGIFSWRGPTLMLRLVKDSQGSLLIGTRLE